jgi:beta-ribofuranosylaminobenzene 5'-phosphate synthase
MYRVETGSRLHFGLVSLAGEAQRWPDHTGSVTIPARRFGGAGLMIDAPGVAVRVEPAREWSAEGPLAARALEVASRLSGEPRRIVVERAAPEHSGLGTGTQLALAVAKALTLSWGRDAAAANLVRMTGRGRRSGVGVHGFDRGGFLVDGGKGERTTLAPLLAHVAFPDEWRILLVIPPSEPGLAGSREQAAFSILQQTPVNTIDALCRLVLLGMLPALHEADLEAFGEALFDFNARSGELFAPVQGGAYVSAAAAVVGWLRGAGVRGVGQSSWGPGVFAVIEDEDKGARLLGRVREAFPQAKHWLTKGRNQGATS